MSEQRFDRIDQALARLEAGQDGLKADMTRKFAEVRADMDRQSEELRRHMGVLHEEALDRIAGVAEGFPRLETKLDREVAELKELIGRCCDPLDAAARHHSMEIERLKKRRG